MGGVAYMAAIQRHVRNIDVFLQQLPRPSVRDDSRAIRGRHFLYKTLQLLRIHLSNRPPAPAESYLFNELRLNGAVEGRALLVQPLTPLQLCSFRLLLPHNHRRLQRHGHTVST